jgi:DNA mismatch endonuclease, patch repair protein
MSGQARRDTAPEVSLRRALHASGLRYRVTTPVPGRSRRTIDIAFTRWRVAVFVDGCFWHGCPAHGTQPKANARWWSQKIATNQARDADTTEHLAEAGWTVVRIWEHEPVDEAATRVHSALQSAGCPTGERADDP